ncbi:enoyl-CoA hydratase/isomerase family protein [Nonomuraea sp. NN258]|uniref:enoyl-CoA hydratase/isomerase family protein n=1 Tax=Nonomuraea antri TaxID=2730852 RepID=UPI00156A51F2|nr:enoyl-CoA hydratase/isomerase family protein [Nonomuraea antri]NRQ35060.1 enoyl-CoA hydratase/isomerase family protein [Nonomuraea antri]
MIEVDMADGIAAVRLAHGKVNALDLELCRAIERTMRDLDDRDHPATAVVLTGTGHTFSAGVDLKRVIDGGAAYVTEFLPALSGAFRAVFDLGKPVVAAINGHAIAGGCVLAAACDHRIMAAGTSRIGVPELRVGVPFPAAALEIMLFALGPVAARRAIFDGTNHEPSAALAQGLVDELIAPDALPARAAAAARDLATGIPADTFRHTKAQLRHETNDRLDRLARDTEPATAELWTTAASDGRIQAFMNRMIRAATDKP